MGDSIVKYTFSSVYKLTRLGAQEVTTSFRSTVLGRFASCNYDQSRDAFVIECGRDNGEDTFFSFLDVFNRYINADTLDTLGTPKVERIEATSLDRPTLGWDIPGDTPELCNNAQDQRGEQAPCLTEWTPKSMQNTFLLELNLSTKESIEELTSCVLQVDTDRTVIRINGVSTTAVDKALNKLDILERKHYQEGLQATELHLIEPEKAKDFALQFLPLRKAGNQMLRSTLLRLDSPHIVELHKKVVARMLTYDESRRVWLPLKKKAGSVTTPAEATPNHGIWETFRFRSLGSESNVFEHLKTYNTDFSSLFPSEGGGEENDVLPVEKVEQVREWQQQVQNNQLDELADPFLTQSALSTTKSSTGEKGEEASASDDSINRMGPLAAPANQYELPSAIESVSPKKRLAKVRRPKATKVIEASSSEHDHEARVPPVATHQPSVTGDSTVSENTSNQYFAPRGQQSHTSCQSAANIQTLEATTDQFSPNLGNLRGMMQQSLTPFLMSDSLRSSSDRPQPLEAPFDRFSVQPRTGEVLPDLSEPAPAQGSRSQAPSPSLVSSVASKAGPVKPVSLLDSVDDKVDFQYMPHLPALLASAFTPDPDSGDVSEPSSSLENGRVAQSQKDPVDERLARSDMTAQGTSNDEVLAEEASTVKSTVSSTSQKTAGRNEKLDTVRLEKLNEIGISMLQHARSFNGDIRLAVDIGRILLSGVPSQFMTSPFAETEWDNVFTARGGSGIPRSTFTNMLTTSFVDASFILSLKTPGGGRLFQEQPHEFKVAYEFNCVTEEAKEIILEVDEFANYEVNKSVEVLALLYWHYPKRAWDAMLTLTGATRVTDFCEDAIKTIINHLEIPEQTLLDLHTKAPSKDLRVQTVLLRRETRYFAIAHPDIVLHLTEVQQLFVERPSKYDLRAFAKPPAEMIKDNRLWYEVSLSSKFAAAKFNENLELELGDDASWEPQEFIDRSVFENLKLVTAKLVSSLDGIGSANQGPRGGPSERAKGQPAASQPAIGFW
ncbi:MAG: hypothetical protein M1835_001724 [Candelina submexicana]|nr:MAG: hypothetical protein M1835_001724 [Candelina submexicana]